MFGYIKEIFFYKINYFSFMILDDSNKMKKKHNVYDKGNDYK